MRDLKTGDWLVTQTSGDGGDGEPGLVTGPGHPAHMASASKLFTTKRVSQTFPKEKSLTQVSAIQLNALYQL